jgi:enediyne biosynthesis protein E4
VAVYLKQFVAFVILAGLLGSVVVLRDLSTSRAETAVDADKALESYGFYFSEVAKKCGINFVHQSSTKFDEKLQHILPIVAGMSASVSVVDFDRDGWPDLFVINSAEGSQCHLYRNNGDGTFTDVAARMGLADLNREGTGICTGAVWGDYDNDGYEDVFVYKWGKPELFHNDKGKGFTRVTDTVAGLPKWANISSAIWVDYDCDGKLDLFLAGYWKDDLDLWHLPSGKVMPESFEYATNGGRKYLLRNHGDGSFEDVTRAAGITSTRWTLAVAAANLCGNRYPDLFLANDYGVSELYANRGGKKFEDIGPQSRVGDTPKSGMCASFGDIYNNGCFSIYVANITEAGNLIQHNNLWVPEPGRTGDRLRYMNQADILNVGNGGWSWGSQFGDFNNDGRLDLYVVNGYISADQNQKYWYDYSKIAGSNAVVIGDAKNWPPIKDKSLSGYQQKCLWINRGGKFVDVAPAVGITDLFDGRSLVLVDLWNRGVLDAVVANQNGPLLVYKNTVNGDNQWVQFELEGTASNRSAIGAEVELHWNGHKQLQMVSGGSGYASQNMRRLHFGLGRDPKVEKAVIRWPSGKTQEIAEPATRTVHQVKEPS